MELTSPDLTLTLHFDVVELKHQVQLSTYCPVESQQTVSHEVKPISLEPEKGLWWHCSCCSGWHIVVLQEDTSSWPDLWPMEEA